MGKKDYYKIAWIDDDFQIIRPVMWMLESKGYGFNFFSTVQEVLKNEEIIRNVDLIVLDLILPGEGHYAGITLLDIIRNKLLISTPVIICSVVHNEYIISELSKFNVSKILTKPILPSTLYSVVTKILK